MSLAEQMIFMYRQSAAVAFVAHDDGFAAAAMRARNLNACQLN